MRDETVSEQDRLLVRLTLALNELRRRAHRLERREPGQIARMWVELTLPDAEQVYFSIVWLSELVVELVIAPGYPDEDPPERTAELRAILVRGGTTELETMHHSAEPRNEDWAFHRLCFGNDIELAAITIRAILLEAHGVNAARHFKLKVCGP